MAWRMRLGQFSDALDDIIAAVAPGLAARRALHRAQQESLASSFRGARHLRTDRSTPNKGRADRHLEQTFDRRRLVDRARQLERSSVLAEGILSRSVENVVGCGFDLEPQSANPQWNDKAKKLWADWGAETADVRGLSTWDEMLALTLRAYLRDGDAATLLLADGSLQQIESDQISSPHGRVLDRRMVDGIHLDRRGRPLTFFIIDDPNPISGSVRYQKHIEVPAESMLYLARRVRHGQTRGISGFSTISWLLDQIDGNIEAVTVAARMAACFGLLITTPSPLGLPTTTGGDGRSRPEFALEPGMVKVLKQGQDVQQLKPEQPGVQFTNFIRTLGRFVGMAFGLPLEIAFGDYSQTNFTSGRLALLSAWRTWGCYQAMLKRYSTKVYYWRLIQWMRTGRLRPRADALQHIWHAPGWKFVDPTKEIQALLAAADGGLINYQQAASEMGNDFIGLLESRKRELDELESAGLPAPARSLLTRDAMDPAEAQPIEAQEPDDSDEEDE